MSSPRIIPLDSPSPAEAIALACQTLADGGIVLYPTETVYGAAVDAANSAAVDRLLAFKRRPLGRSVPVLVANAAMADTLVTRTDEAKRIYETWLPGPVSVISKAVPGAVDARLPSEAGGLAMRISSHPIAAALVAAYGRPITATAAHAPGAARGYGLESIKAGLSEGQWNEVSLVLDAGTLPPNDLSTVLDTTSGVQQAVRLGAGGVELVPAHLSDSVEATMAAAAELAAPFLARRTEAPAVFALVGDLGAGKTHAAKAIATAAGVTEPVTSPSFTLMKEYPLDGGTFYHLDLWRAAAITAAELGLDQLLRPGNVVVVEWPQPILPALADQAGFVLELAALDETRRELRVRSLAQP